MSKIKSPKVVGMAVLLLASLALSGCGAETKVTVSTKSETPKTADADLKIADNKNGEANKTDSPVKSDDKTSKDADTDDRLSKLQGVWEDTTDSMSVVEYKGNKETDYYDGEKMSEIDFTLEKSCTDKPGIADDTKDIIVEPDNMCWQVASVNDKLLELIYLGRGNTLTYKKITELPKAKAKIVTKADGTKGSKGIAAYFGLMFDVKYPADFVASPLTPSAVFEGDTHVQTDEATFKSPDGSVEFFVYSPQWSGQSDYLKAADNEQLVSEKTEKNAKGDRIVYMATYKAKDNSYTRSLNSTKDQVGTGNEVHSVFGIKYKNQAAYDKYKGAYLAFKASLTQYAD